MLAFNRPLIWLWGRGGAARQTFAKRDVIFALAWLILCWLGRWRPGAMLSASCGVFSLAVCSLCEVIGAGNNKRQYARSYAIAKVLATGRRTCEDLNLVALATFILCVIQP